MNFIVDPKVKELRDHRATAAAALDDGNVHCSGATRVRVPLHVALLSPLRCKLVVYDRGCVNLRELYTEPRAFLLKPRRAQGKGALKHTVWDSGRCRRSYTLCS